MLSVADQFSYWYISLFLILIGIGGLVASRYLNLLKCNFWLELRDPIAGPRLRAVLNRREPLESLGRKPVVISSLSYLFFGAMCLAHIVTPAIAYALACAEVALTFAWMYARVRNRSQRRAASLAPRRQSSVVPPLAFIGALVAAAVPLLFVSDASLRFSALLVSLASFAIIISAWSIAGMAAVLTGDDADFEVYVDDRIRRVRVGSMLTFAYAVVPVFIAVVTREAAALPVYDYAFYVSMGLAVAFLAWYAIDYLRGRAPRTDGI